ncbi:hypothetical protein [Microbacterium sp. NPDC087665]|uniref:hypothetical protein n=1 Tax=Microbacterium sp. NPDC087665 TaxID=3364194 RepID=UPI003819F390
MPEPEATLIDEGAVRAACGLPASGEDGELTRAIAAARAYVERYHGVRATWPDDYRLGAIRLATGLYRDAAQKGMAEPFGQSNTARRATDIEIEQLLRIGRFAGPQIG